MAGITTNVLLIIILKQFDSLLIIKTLIKFNKIMILFNIIPVFPLDGYRIISDLVNNNILFEEIYLYLSILITIILMIIFYIFKIYGFIFILLYLLKLSIDKLRQTKIRQNVINSQIKYEINKYLYQD